MNATKKKAAKKKTTKKKTQESLSFDLLKPAPYNPREIDEESETGLAKSIEEFGDISGITWNRQTGHIVSGHQRVEQLRQFGGVFEGEEIVVGDDPETQVRFRVRVVDWDETREKAANLAANSQHIAGKFTPAAANILEELRDALDPEIFRSLRMERLLEDVALPAEFPEFDEGIADGLEPKTKFTIVVKDDREADIVERNIVRLQEECPSMKFKKDTTV